MEHYQKAFDEFTAGIRQHIAKLEAHRAKISAHERSLSKTLKPRGGKARSD
jgi:hypothetical protein